MSDRKHRFLPYGRQCIDDDDVAAVSRVLRGDWLTTGPAVDAFEAAFAEAVGAEHAVACANGTAALHLAALSLGLGPGDRVVVPTMTFLATANAARFVGADVVFADVDPATGLLTAETLQAAIDAAGPVGLRAVFPVHLNGQCVDLPAIRAIADRHGLAVVEDACHALGAAQEAGDVWVPIGACQDSTMAAFSMHPVKTIAMGEGGVVTTRDDALADALRRGRNHGMVRDAARFELAADAFDAAGEAHPWYYEMPEPGFNYRASDIHCALGLSQLGKLRRFVEARARLVAAYDRLIAPLAPTVRPIGRVDAACRPAWHLYVVAIDFAACGVDRGAVMRRLRDAGIGTQVHYFPVHRQPYYRKLYVDRVLPGADAYYAAALSLPLFPAMDEADVERVVDALQGALRPT